MIPLDVLAVGRKVKRDSSKLAIARLDYIHVVHLQSQLVTNAVAQDQQILFWIQKSKNFDPKRSIADGRSQAQNKMKIYANKLIIKKMHLIRGVTQHLGTHFYQAKIWRKWIGIMKSAEKRKTAAYLNFQLLGSADTNQLIRNFT